MKIAVMQTPVLSNLPNTSTEFRISDMNLVMELLTKLYSNPIQTITQEYIANARDAHREIGQTKKVRITAPSRFSSVLSIEDFGPGLSPDRIQNVFVYYGSSTKRATNDQNGGFGIGAKSAWAYTDSFTIISRHDGMKRTYVAHRSNAKGNLQLISEETTEESNGTAIEIAVRPTDVNAFRNAIRRAVYFWNSNEAPELLGFTPDELSEMKRDVAYQAIHNDTIMRVYNKLPGWINYDYYSTNGLVVIDGIPYPNRISMDRLENRFRLPYVIYLNTGDVTMLPSREEFTVDDKANKLLTSLDIGLCKAADEYLDRELAAANGLVNGLKRVMSLRQIFRGNMKYKGWVIDNDGRASLPKDPSNRYDVHVLGTHFSINRRQKLWKREFSVFNANNLAAMVYDDMPGESAVKRMWRIRKLMAANSNNTFLVKTQMKEVADELGIVALSSIDASDYKANRAAKAAVTKQEVCIHWSYGYRTASPKQVQLSEIEDTVVYAPLTDRNTVSEEVIQWINRQEGYRFGFISPSYFGKIANDSRFITYDKYIADFKPTDEQVLRYLKSLNYPNGFDALHKVRKAIVDPVVRYFITLESQPAIGSVLPEKLIPDNHVLVEEFHKMAEEAKKLSDKFPLLTALMTGNLSNKEYVNDLVNYLNQKA